MTTATKNSQYVEFDEFIEFQLQKTRQGIKVTDLVTALCGVSVAVLAYLLVFAICDHWLIPGGFGYFWRLALLGGLLVGSASWVGFKVILPSMRRINQLYAARAIEGVSPELDSNLINWVDLRNSGRDVSPLILRSIEKRAAVSLSHADVDEAVDRQALLKLLYALLAVVALFAAYVVFSPKKVGPSIWRALLPTSNVQVATRTQIEKVDPPGAEVPAGSLLEVTADLLGDAPTQVVLKYTTADRRVVDRAIEMRQVEEGLKRYRCMLDGERGEGLMQDFDFWVGAGDAQSASFHVTVIQPPSASVTDLVYDFPKYTQKERETQPSGKVDTLEGTTVTFNATTNMPVKSALLQFSDDEKFASKGEEKALRVTDGTKLTADWKAEFRSDGTFPKYYRIQVKTDRGLTDPSPAVQTILLRRDVAPEIELVAPRLNMSLFANAIVPVVVKARDPDFLLRDVQLFAIKGEKQIFDKVIDEKRVSETEVRFEWKLADLNLKAGDTLTMYVAARDNKEPFSNRKESQRRVIDIIEPGSAKQVEEQLAKDKQNIEELQQTDKQNNEKRDENDPSVESPDKNNNPTSDPRDNEKPNEDKKPRDDQQNKDRQPQDPKGDESSNDNEKSSPSKNGSKKTGSKSEDNKDESSNNDRKTESDPKSKKTGDQSQQSSDTGDSKDKDGKSQEQQPLKNNGEDDADALRRALERQQQRDRQSKSSEPKPNESDSKEKQGGTKDGAEDKSTEQPKGSNDKQKQDPASGDQPMPDKGASNSDSKKNDTADAKPMTGADQDKGAEKTDEKKPDGQTSPKSDGKTGDQKTESKSPMNAEKKSNSETKTNDSKGKDDSTDKADTPSKDPGASSNQPDGKKPQPNQKESKTADGTNSKESKPNDPKSAESDAKKTENNDATKKDDADSKKSQSKPGDKAEDKERSQDGGDSKPSGDQKPAGSKPKDQSDDSQGKSSKSKDDKSGSDSTPSKNGDQPKKSDTPQKAKQGGSKDADSQDKTASEKDGKDPTEGDSKKDKPEAKSKDSKKEGKPEAKDDNDSPKQGDKKSDMPGAKDGKSKSKQTGEDSGDSDAKDGDGTAKPKDGGAASKGKPGKLQSREGNPDASKSDGASSGDADVAPEPVNLDDKKKATNLVLKKLKEELERGEVDQEFLKDLGWTENDLKRFVDRLDQQSKAGNDTPAEQARRRQFEEMLKSLDLRSGGGTKQDTHKAKRSTNDFGDKQVPVPLEYRDAYKKYADKLSKQKKNDATK